MHDTGMNVHNSFFQLFGVRVEPKVFVFSYFKGSFRENLFTFFTTSSTKFYRTEKTSTFAKLFVEMLRFVALQLYVLGHKNCRCRRERK
jgi:hypothetical protein